MYFEHFPEEYVAKNIANNFQFPRSSNSSGNIATAYFLQDEISKSTFFDKIYISLRGINFPILDANKIMVVKAVEA